MYILVVFQYFRFKSISMRITKFFLSVILLTQVLCQASFAQQDPIVAAIIKEANDNSQLKRMQHQLQPCATIIHMSSSSFQLIYMALMKISIRQA